MIVRLYIRRCRCEVSQLNSEKHERIDLRLPGERGILACTRSIRKSELEGALSALPQFEHCLLVRVVLPQAVLNQGGGTKRVPESKKRPRGSDCMCESRVTYLRRHGMIRYSHTVDATRKFQPNKMKSASGHLQLSSDR